MELDGDAKFLFFTMMQAAIRMKSIGKSQKDYIEFAKGIWESLELNNPEELQNILHESMIKDIKRYIK